MDNLNDKGVKIPVAIGDVDRNPSSQRYGQVITKSTLDYYNTPAPIASATPTLSATVSNPLFSDPTKIVSGSSSVRDAENITRSDAKDLNSDIAGLRDTIVNSQAYADTAVGKQNQADLDVMRKSLGVITSQDQDSITRAGVAAGSQYDPLISDAQNQKAVGLPKAVVAAGERGGFMNTQFAGVAALVPTNGNNFIGAGGELERIQSVYDKNIQDLQSRKLAAIAQAEAAAKQAILTGKRQDYELAASALKDAQSAHDNAIKLANEKLTAVQNYDQIVQARKKNMTDEQDKLTTQVAPNIYEDIKANPNIPYDQILKEYSDQYGIDPIKLSGALINYKTDREKDDILNTKNNLDIIKSVVESSGKSQKVNIDGVGEVTINPQKELSTVNANGQVYIFDKNSGKLSATGLKSEDLSPANILSAIKDLNDPNVLKSFLTGQGVNLGVQSFTVSNNNDLQALAQSLVAQESGGNYQAVGADTPQGNALGKYQIMPFHLPEIGLQNTPEDRKKFLNSPELQDKLFNQIISGLSAQYGGDAAKIAAAYYGGRGGATVVGTPAGDKPQYAVVGGKTKEFPSVNEYVKSVLSRVPQANTANTKLTKDQLKEKNNIIQNIRQDPDVKGYIEIRDAYDRVKAAAKNPSPAGDLALIYNYMKVQDPGSTVRETEFANAENAGNVDDKTRSLYNKVVTGKRLSEEQRKDFVDRVDGLYAPKFRNYQSAVKFYEQQAKDQDIPFELVMRDFTTPADVDPKIEKARSQLQPGEILVQDSSGQIGGIAQADFDKDPSKYKKL